MMLRIGISVLLAAIFIGGCGSARRGVPLLGPMEFEDPAVARGERIFMRTCSPCHPRGESGIGPALNNKWLPDWVIRTQVRVGFGAMPGFPEEVLSDENLEAVIAYLDYLRHRGPFSNKRSFKKRNGSLAPAS